MRFRFRHLAAVTTGLTFVLILLGVYTGAIGAGLSCNARWPLCDGWMGLFPATWPSFVEWFHRFVAMITGFCILGTAAFAWRGGYEKRIRYASGLAVAILPVQVMLGANTIWSYGPTAQVLHHTAALSILVSLVAATAWAFEAKPAEPATDAADAEQEAGSSDPVRL